MTTKLTNMQKEALEKFRDRKPTDSRKHITEYEMYGVMGIKPATVRSLLQKGLLQRAHEFDLATRRWSSVWSYSLTAAGREEAQNED